ncbi:hypothetical protein MITSMUL_04749 [Mitsuokella multacida DSM 20544]|uniref:Uncharacterized protein n=1 Tax=Mitsuokella multacida DSM 20544 TaxID=500635 RepID=C9KNQ9_9FIRM|nr:hypothetical protein MITSMUL_04749 [Mitsuokella multacida DSM 20544]
MFLYIESSENNLFKENKCKRLQKPLPHAIIKPVSIRNNNRVSRGNMRKHGHS